MQLDIKRQVDGYTGNAVAAYFFPHTGFESRTLNELKKHIYGDAMRYIGDFLETGCAKRRKPCLWVPTSFSLCILAYSFVDVQWKSPGTVCYIDPSHVDYWCLETYIFILSVKLLSVFASDWSRETGLV